MEDPAGFSTVSRSISSHTTSCLSFTLTERRLGLILGKMVAYRPGGVRPRTDGRVKPWRNPQI